MSGVITTNSKYCPNSFNLVVFVTHTQCVFVRWNLSSYLSCTLSFFLKRIITYSPEVSECTARFNAKYPHFSHFALLHVRDSSSSVFLSSSTTNINFKISSKAPPSQRYPNFVNRHPSRHSVQIQLLLKFVPPPPHTPPVLPCHRPTFSRGTAWEHPKLYIFCFFLVIHIGQLPPECEWCVCVCVCLWCVYCVCVCVCGVCTVCVVCV